MKINEGPLLQIFSMTEKVAQCLFMIESSHLTPVGRVSGIGRKCPVDENKQRSIVADIYNARRSCPR
jgi:hypothetical protein